MDRAQKAEQIKQIHEQFDAFENVFLVDMAGLNVPDVTELRRRIKARSGACRVVKNRLAIRAAGETQASVLADRFRGPIGIVTHPDDPVAIAKVLDEFAKDHPALELRGASIAGSLTEPDQLKYMASLPGFDELRSMLLAVLQAPAQKLVRLLNTPANQLARALDAHREKMDGGS